MVEEAVEDHVRHEPEHDREPGEHDIDPPVVIGVLEGTHRLHHVHHQYQTIEIRLRRHRSLGCPHERFTSRSGNTVWTGIRFDRLTRKDGEVAEVE
jgi:hypothetical protein